jgi:tetratricopeptide (TPR) repeat protein
VFVRGKNKFMKSLSVKLLVIICLACGSVFAQTNDALAKQAYAALQEDKFEDAIMLCEKILQADPVNALAAYTCGFANFQLKRFLLAEKYLVAVEAVKKDDVYIYALLGSAYFRNRAKDKSLADFNTSLEYLAKAIKLDPKFPSSYEFRADAYWVFYGESGLKANPQLKEALYSDLRKLILLNPKDEQILYFYAVRSYQLGDSAQALPVFAKFVDSPNVNLEYAGNVCKNIRNYVNRASELPSGEDNPSARENPKLWNDAISFAKSCKNAHARLETDETIKKQKVSEFRAETIFYRIRRGEKNKADYLASPEYLADLTEAIDAGEIDYYNNRIEVYTFLKQFAKADADTKSKESAQEARRINDVNIRIERLITEEKNKKQEEDDFDKKSSESNGTLKSENFAKLLSMKKSRLILIDKILGFTISEKYREAFSTKRTKLAEVIDGGEKTIKANEKLDAYNYKMSQSRNVECIDCDAIGASRANRKKVAYQESAVGFLNEAIGILNTITPKPTSWINELFEARRLREEEIRKMRATFLNDF